MEENVEYGILDINNEAEIIEYERGLYRAFKAKSPDGWISNKYKQIGDDRLQHPTFDYSDQVIYTIRVKGKLIGAGAVNIHNKEYELLRKGFLLSNEDKESFLADGLNLFAEDGVLPADQFMNVFIRFAEFALEDLKRRGVEYWYSTVYRIMKATYLIFGFEVCDEKEIDGKNMFLMRYDVKAG